MTIPHWDRHGLEHLVRYCARPPLSHERLGRLNEQTLVYSLRRPTADGRTELLLTPNELLDLLSQLVTPPRLHKHRYCGVLAPNAALRAAVTASAGPAGATLQLLEQARSPPQLAFGFDQTSATTDWPEMDQTAGTNDGWHAPIAISGHRARTQPTFPFLIPITSY